MTQHDLHMTNSFFYCIFWCFRTTFPKKLKLIESKFKKLWLYDLYSAWKARLCCVICLSSCCNSFNCWQQHSNVWDWYMYGKLALMCSFCFLSCFDDMIFGTKYYFWHLLNMLSISLSNMPFKCFFLFYGLHELPQSTFSVKGWLGKWKLFLLNDHMSYDQFIGEFQFNQDLFLAFVLVPVLCSVAGIVWFWLHMIYCHFKPTQRKRHNASCLNVKLVS